MAKRYFLVLCVLILLASTSAPLTAAASSGVSTPDSSAPSTSSADAFRKVWLTRPALKDYLAPASQSHQMPSLLGYNKTAGILVTIMGAALIGLGAGIVYDFYADANANNGRVSVFRLSSPAFFVATGGLVVGMGIDLLRPDKPKRPRTPSE